MDMKSRFIALATTAAALIIAAPASAVVYVEGTGEPAFTNSQQNTNWVRWQGSSAYDQYRVEFDYYTNSVLNTTANVPVAANGSGTMWANWSGVATLVEGNSYGICTYGRYWIGGIPS